jgi:hypothetical protein
MTAVGELAGIATTSVLSGWITVALLEVAGGESEAMMWGVLPLSRRGSARTSIAGEPVGVVEVGISALNKSCAGFYSKYWFIKT